MIFYDWSATHNLTEHVVVLRKAAIFPHGVNGHRVHNMKGTLLDFSFSLIYLLFFFKGRK